ncbi:RDD family protein [Oceaniglobus ichthyenteri]|uniref:RDD family protein n=1 Tax=Oceaniglobus ichthyenteri TaxID=2136177 RepID=UPI000D3C8EBF|nr:RDD family protein [Oceaniglobus ichthyenteri]
MRFDDIRPDTAPVNWGLPDPDRQSGFYENVPSKRLLAWVVDVVIIGVITAVLVPFTLFIGLFFLPMLFGVISFMYRVVSLANWSGTPGMRLMAIELRTSQGARFDLMAAFLHTLGYAVSVTFFPVQLISIVLMLTSARAQGLTDYVMGTAALNRAAS